MTDLEKNILAAVREGLSAAVLEKLNGYNSPLDGMLKSVIDQNAAAIRTLFTDAITTATSDAEWRESIASAVRAKLARTLIEKFGGELEKQVNALKSDPTTRARITLAIEEILKAKE